MILAGCLEMEVTSQPQFAQPNSTFNAELMVQFRQDGGISADDDRAMIFAVMKPENWTINNISYTSPEHDEGIFSYLGNAADEDEAGGIDYGWQDSLEQDFPSPTGMHWQVYVSDKDTTSSSNVDDPDTFNIVVNYAVDDAGNYYDPAQR